MASSGLSLPLLEETKHTIVFAIDGSRRLVDCHLLRPLFVLEVQQ